MLVHAGHDGADALGLVRHAPAAHAQICALGQHFDADLCQLGGIARQQFLGTARQHGKGAGAGDGVVGMQRLATQHGAPAAHGTRARQRTHAQDCPHERRVKHRAAALDIARKLLKDHVATLELLELRLALALAPVNRLVVKA